MTDPAFMTKVKEALSKAQGWCTPEKAERLIQYVIEAPADPKIVEIGVFGGSSLVALGLAAQKKGGNCKVYGIDPWSTDAALEDMNSTVNREWWGSIDMNAVFVGCQRLMDIYGLTHIVELIRSKSEDVVDRFEDESLDILHIDGNHAETLSFKDVQLYLPKLKKGGIIFFDDIWWTDNSHDVTTRKAILFLSQECTRIDVVQDCMILRKD